MAKLILKSPYIKCGGGKNASGYLNYIGTREGVEMLPDNRPPTRKQTQLVNKLCRDFPAAKKLREYEQYESAPTKYHASLFINEALEENLSRVSTSEGYMRYIANRPRVERVGDHGLFGDEDHVDLNTAMAELQSYTGNVWTHIISLKREDASRLGYDNAKAWLDLIRAHRNEIAEAMQINPDNFRWYAAFHDEGDHPHIHMMAWSKNPKQGYLSREGLQSMKSLLTNDIFRMEMLQLYRSKSQSRDELVQTARDTMVELAENLRQKIADVPEIEQLLLELSYQLPQRGKKSYGYLPRKQKELVNQIVDALEQLPSVHRCYETWLMLQHQIESYYKDAPRKRLPLSAQTEFRSVKNAVIREADQLRAHRFTLLEDDDATERWSEREDVACRDTAEVWRRLRDRTLPEEELSRVLQSFRYDAEDGDPTANYYLGKLFRDGDIVPRDLRTAREYFDLAAEDDDFLPAQYALGMLLLSEDPSVQDADEGLRWLVKASENGSDAASYQLGKLCLSSKLVQRDPELARYYLERAAELYHPGAMCALGLYYLSDEDGQYDPELAREHLSKAAEYGDGYARYLLSRDVCSHPHPSVLLCGTRLLGQLARAFQDWQNQKKPPARIDSKLLSQLMQKRAAHGLKGDYTESYDYQQSM